MKTTNPYSPFDEMMREQLSSLNPEAPEGVWEAMESSLDTLNQSLQFDSAIRESVEQINIPAPDGVFQAIQSQIGSGMISSGLSIAGKWILGSVIAGVVATSAWFAVNQDEVPDKEEIVQHAELNVDPSTPENVDDKERNETDNSGLNVRVPDESESGSEQRAGMGMVAGSTYPGHPQTNPQLNAPTPANTNTEVPANGPADGQQGPTRNASNQLTPAVGFTLADTMICEGQPYSIFLVNADNCVYDLLINGVAVCKDRRGTEGFQHTMSESGLYLVECVLRRGEQVWRRTQFLHVNPLPEVKPVMTDLGNGRYLFENKEQAKTSWYLDGAQQSKADIQLYDPLPKDHRISAHVTNELGCSDSADLEFRNNYPFKIKDLNAPNAFSPGNDGKNDVYAVEIEGASYYQIYIFNSESQLVFESNDPKESWDGRDKFKENRIVPGIYTCVIKYALAGGELQHFTDKIHLIKE